jgi:dTDP-4-dehydrorhamnose reductase
MMNFSLSAQGPQSNALVAQSLQERGATTSQQRGDSQTMRENKTIVIGCNGQLGTDLLRCFSENVVALTHDDLEITNANDVVALFRDVKPSLVVNTAAFHQTARCDQYPAKAYEVNAVGAVNLAKACELVDALLVHISTDYVFDGAKGAPYVETDPVRPLSVYGLSKAAGEAAVMNYCRRHYVVRSCGLYGRVPSRAKGDNFITKVLRTAQNLGEVTVVDDEIVTPTWTLSLARQIRRLCEAESSIRYGIVHASDEGQCSWYEFTAEIFRLTRTAAVLKPVSVAESRPDVRRPRYSVLENRALNDARANIMQTWRSSLAQYLESTGQLKSTANVPQQAPRTREAALSVRTHSDPIPARFDVTRKKYKEWPPMW